MFALVLLPLIVALAQASTINTNPASGVQFPEGAPYAELPVYSCWDEQGAFVQTPVKGTCTRKVPHLPHVRRATYSVDIDFSAISWTGTVTHKGNQTTATLNMRVLEGRMPGPTIRLNAGDTLKVRLHNRLEENWILRHPINAFRTPNTTNLHTHGLHITSKGDADNVKVEIEPGSYYDYVYDIPNDHSPGTYWMHPHHHGAVSIQVGGGAAMALIINDPLDGSIPADILAARERTTVFTLHDLPLIQRVYGKLYRGEPVGHPTFDYIDPLLAAAVGSTWTTLNGVHAPTVTMNANEWERWRMPFVSSDTPLNFWLPTACEARLLAKDGIYIEGFPSRFPFANITAREVQITPGGRVDMMIACSDTGGPLAIEYLATSDINHSTNRKTLMTINVVRGANSPAQPPTFAAFPNPPRPDYLQDTRNEVVPPECSCSTQFQTCGGGEDNNRINGLLFSPYNILHISPSFSVVERYMCGTRHHPYHVHVNPFQLLMNAGDLHKAGDWHDTFMSEASPELTHPVYGGGGGCMPMRQRTHDFEGEGVMIHCHKFYHEDSGMMAMEYIGGREQACSCSPINACPNNYNYTAPTPQPVAHPTNAPIDAGLKGIPTPRPVSPTPSPSAASGCAQHVSRRRCKGSCTWDSALGVCYQGNSPLTTPAPTPMPVTSLLTCKEIGNLSKLSTFTPSDVYDICNKQSYCKAKKNQMGGVVTAVTCKKVKCTKCKNQKCCTENPEGCVYNPVAKKPCS